LQTGFLAFEVRLVCLLESFEAPAFTRLFRLTGLEGTHLRGGFRFRLRLGMYDEVGRRSPFVQRQTAKAAIRPIRSLHVASKKPNVHALARDRDEFGLAEAAGYLPSADARSADPDAGAAIREQAISALGGLGPDAGAEAVKWALQDPSEQVRCAAVRVLALRGESADLAAALAWLEPSADSHRLAVEAILDTQVVSGSAAPGIARTVVSALVRANGTQGLNEEVPELVHMLVRAEQRPDAIDDVVGELVSALPDDRHAVAVRAELLLESLAPDSTDALISALRNGVAPHRAAGLLGRIRDLSALDALAEALDDPDPRVRTACAIALGELRHPDAVEPLLAATRDPDAGVRASASAALDGMGSLGIITGVAAVLRVG
jgi:HEAT repeat protein